MEIYKYVIASALVSGAAAEQAPMLDGNLLLDFKPGDASGNHLLMGFDPESIKYMDNYLTLDLLVRTGNPQKERSISVTMATVVDCETFQYSTTSMITADYQTGASANPVVLNSARWLPIERDSWSAMTLETACDANTVDEVIQWAAQNHAGVLMSVSEQMIGMLDVTNAGRINWRVNSNAEPVLNELGVYLIENNPNFSR